MNANRTTLLSALISILVVEISVLFILYWENMVTYFDAHPWMTNILAVCIAMLALCVSFRQAFYKPRRIRVITMRYDNAENVRFGICNGGKVNAYITEVSAKLIYPPDRNIISRQIKTFALSDTGILNSGGIAEFQFNMADVREALKKEIPYALDMTALIHCAFPDGKTYIAEVPIGKCSATEDKSNSRIHAVNFDFLKHAKELRIYNNIDSEFEE